MCILLLGWLFYIWLLCLIGLYCFPVLYFLTCLSSRCSIHYCKLGIEVSNHYCQNVYLSLQLWWCLLHIFRGALLFGVHMFIMVTSSWLLTILSIYNVLICLVTLFDLKSILSDISIANPTLWSLFPWNNFFHPLTLNLCVPLELNQISYRQYLVVSYFFIHPVKSPIFEWRVQPICIW